MAEIEAMEEEEKALQAQHDALMQQQMEEVRAEAAVRIQSLQRGKAGRERVDQRRQDLAPKPPIGSPLAGRHARLTVQTPPQGLNKASLLDGGLQSPMAQQLHHKLALIRGEIDGMQNQIVQCLARLDDDALDTVTSLNAAVDRLVNIERQVAIAIDHRQRMDAPPPVLSPAAKSVKFHDQSSPSGLSAHSGYSGGVGGSATAAPTQLAPIQAPAHNHTRAPPSGGNRSGGGYRDMEDSERGSHGGGAGGGPPTLSHRERLINFYRQQNPAMLDKVDAILAKYRGHEEVLFQKLARKYNLSAGELGQEPRPQWDGAAGGNKRRSVSDISGKNRANEVGAAQKANLRSTEQNVNARLLRNQIELENRLSNMQSRYY